MDNNFFLNTGIPPALHFEPAQSMPSWRSLSTAMDIQSAADQNFSSARSPERFYNPNWDKQSTDHQSVHFESALSSMVSSPVASNSNISNESFVIRELIGKLGSIGSNANEISATINQGNNSYMGGGNGSTNTSCYSTPLNSPPKLNLPIMDHLAKEKFPSLGKPVPLNSSVAEFSADPGFAERAAKFSCFGSRSFNGRTTQQLGTHTNNSEVGYRSNQLMGNGNKLSRVSSSPSLKALGSQTEQRNSQLPDSREESKSTVVSEQRLNPIGETGMVPSSSTDFSSRKRKAASKGKAKDPVKVKLVCNMSKSTQFPILILVLPSI